MNETNTLPEMQDLSEQIGEFVYYWGFKRIHGRIWTHLFLAQKPLDAADLVRLMNISKALVSISLRELMEYEVIQFSGKSARGTQLYKVNPDILSVIMAVLRQREKRMLSHVQAAQEGLMRVPEADQARNGLSVDNLRQLGDLVQKAVVALDGFIALRPVDFSDWQSIFMLKDGKSGDGKVADGDGHGNGGYPATVTASKSPADSGGIDAAKPAAALSMESAPATELLPTARQAF